MAIYPLHDQFRSMQQRIALGSRALVAIAAHLEVRSVLRASNELRAHGLDDLLIGSYARKVSIWPGRDVDVFGRLMTESVSSIPPDAAYEAFRRALQYFEAAGRLTAGPRSFKIDYSPDRTPSAGFIRTAAQEYGWARGQLADVLANLRERAFEFSVDVVPAVRWGAHYGIPETGRHSSTGERYRTGHWRRTNPVDLIEETKVRNRAPRVAGVGAYVRTVKSVRQIKTHHLRGARPSSLYYEFVLYEGFATGVIGGDSWADIMASALSFIVSRLGTVRSQPVCDPVLHEPYIPAPEPTELAAARSLFESSARRARRAVTTSEPCQAALEWRQVFGGNAQAEHVFPLPPGCRGTGAAMGAAAANLSSGGTGEKGFGAR
jgi:hypothetical protein